MFGEQRNTVITAVADCHFINALGSLQFYNRICLRILLADIFGQYHNRLSWGGLADADFGAEGV